MLTGLWIFPVAFFASLAIATIASPAGVSGAVFLLPFQVSVLGTPSPAVTPTNLLFNVVATPGALYRYWRQGQTGGRLTRQLLIGTVPGVVAGSVVRVEVLPGPQAFDAIIAVVLIPLGSYLILRQTATRPSGIGSTIPLVPIAVVVGCVGGMYGIGGGSILAPVLIGAGRSPTDVAPATLTSTFLTSVAGVATFLVLASVRHGTVAPDWGCRTGTRCRRRPRRLPRRPHPTPPPRGDHPAAARSPRCRHRRSLRLARHPQLRPVRADPPRGLGTEIYEGTNQVQRICGQTPARVDQLGVEWAR